MWRVRLSKWLPRVMLVMFGPALLVVAWGELSAPASEVEQIVWDKTLHFIAYFGLSGIIAAALKGDRRVMTSTLLVAVFGGFLEILQGFTGRDPSLMDELANILGAVSGTGAGCLVIWLLKQKPLLSRGRLP